MLVFTAAPPDRYLVLAIGPYIQRFLQTLYIFNGTVDDEITNKFAYIYIVFIVFFFKYQINIYICALLLPLFQFVLGFFFFKKNLKFM